MWIVALLNFVILILLIYFNIRKPKNFPPGPKWWPIMGCATLIIKMRKKYGNLLTATANLAKIYGPIIGLKVGKDLIVIVYGKEEIQDFLSREELSGRPTGFFFEKRTWGKRRGIMLTDQEFWREQRRFLLRHLREFGFGRQTMSALIEEEAGYMIDYLNKSLKQSNGSVILNGESLFNIPILNTLWKMLCGVRYNATDSEMVELQALLVKLLRSVSMVGCTFSHFPILRYLAPESSGFNLYIDAHNQIWKFLYRELEKHKETRIKDSPRDVMDVYLDVLENKSPTLHESFSEEQLIAICLDMFMAGTETTSNTLAFCFLYLILNPEIQMKAQREIDEVIGRERMATLDDRPKMPYIECIILEALRMFSGQTFTLPHRALEDTYLNGHFIPKDVIIIANLHGALMGSQSGIQNPELFKPERYLKNGKPTNLDYFIPFGFGKHRCMGETLAKANLFLFITSMLQNFNFSVVTGHPPDMRVTDGVTPAPVHYKIQISPRFF